MLSPFSDQEERAYLHQLRVGVEQILQREDQSFLTLAERDRLRHRLTFLDGWELMAQALADGNVEQLSRAAEQMEHLEFSDDTMWQQHRLALFAIAWRMSGNFPPMVAALQETWKRTRMAQHRYQEAHTLWGLIAALIALGQLSQAHDHNQELEQLVNSLGGSLPVAAYTYLFQAQLAYAWNRLEEAKRAAQKAIEQTAPLQYLGGPLR